MLSFVVCSHHAGKYAALRGHLNQRLRRAPFEVIAIHDARSMAEGYNRGLKQSRGEVVVFCHDDVEILTAPFYERLMSHMRRCDVLGIAGTSKLVGPDWRLAGAPHVFGQLAWPAERFVDVVIFGAHRPLIGKMMALEGIFLAFRRPVIEALGWDEMGFPGFHGCELDVSVRAHVGGYRVAVASDLGIFHDSAANPALMRQDEEGRIRAKLQPYFVGTPPAEPTRFAIARCKTKASAAATMELPAVVGRAS